MVDMSMDDGQDENPWGFLVSLQEGRDWLERLEYELLNLANDLMNLDDQLSESSKNVIKFTIAKTEEAIQQIELEMKMFKE